LSPNPPALYARHTQTVNLYAPLTLRFGLTHGTGQLRAMNDSLVRSQSCDFHVAARCARNRPLLKIKI
jgi:hypothetical protein